MLFLFSGDETVQQLQRQASRLMKGAVLTPAEQRREAIDDARELREHARWRGMAFMLFVAPAIVSVFVLLVALFLGVLRRVGS